MIQVTGVLKTPMNQPAGNAEIRITSLDSSGECLSFLNSYLTTGTDGSYDFQLLEGNYSIEVLFCREFMLAGMVHVSSVVPSPITLPKLLQDFAIGRRVPEVRTSVIYAGFDVNSDPVNIEPEVMKGTSIATATASIEVSLHRAGDDPEYIWVFIPDGIGIVQGFNFGANFVQPWLNKAATVNNQAGKIYVSDYPTHAQSVTFKIITEDIKYA